MGKTGFVSLCHLWLNDICDAAALGKFHMHVHMLVYTQQIEREGGLFQLFGETQGSHCGYCGKHRNQAY